MNNNYQERVEGKRQSVNVAVNLAKDSLTMCQFYSHHNETRWQCSHGRPSKFTVLFCSNWCTQILSTLQLVP